MLLDAGRVHLAVEHKVGAAQGRDQLARYSALPQTEVTHVALVAADYQAVPKLVATNRRFLQPATGQSRFVWADFHPVLQRAEDCGVEVAAAARRLFDDLGLQPAHPLIGHLHGTDAELRAERDARLSAAWTPLLRRSFSGP